jgi:hypothetical protein
MITAWIVKQAAVPINPTPIPSRRKMYEPHASRNCQSVKQSRFFGRFRA